jgi:hypothetical protein
MSITVTGTVRRGQTRDYNLAGHGIRHRAAPGGSPSVAVFDLLGSSRGYSFARSEQIKAALAIYCAGYKALFL